MIHKAIFNSAILVKALEYCKKAITNKSIPIIENFLIEVEGDKATVCSTDLNTWIKITMLVESNKSNFKFLLPSAAIVYLNKIEDQMITLSVDSEIFKVEIYDDGSVAKYASEDSDHYPIGLSFSNEKHEFVVSAQTIGEFPELLKNVGVDDLKGQLTGIHFELNDGKLNLTATDQLTLRTVAVDGYDADARHDTAFILPHKTAKIIQSFKIAEDVLVTYEKEGSRVVGFEFNKEDFGVKIITKAIDADYPEYWTVIRDTSSTKFITNKDALVKGITKALMFAAKTTGAIKFSISAEKTVLSAEDIDFVHNYNGTVLGIVVGDGIEIGFNGKLLSKVIFGFNGKDISLEVNRANEPVLIREGNVTAICMPFFVE